ncbi:unnamed protein product [Boreogadus saida]
MRSLRGAQCRLFRGTLAPVEKALRDRARVQDIVPVGLLHTRDPKIQKLLLDGPNLKKSLNPDEAGAYGAAGCIQSLLYCTILLLSV